jgi:hypothetical protein
VSSVIPSGVAHSDNVDIHTPPYIFAGIPLSFDLDPASPLSGPVTPARHHYTLEQDGLTQPWFGMVWLNPPYNRWEIGRWIAKLAEHGRGVALVYACTDTAWFQDYPPDRLLLLRGRVRFVERKGSRTVSGASPSMLMAYGREAVEGLAGATLKGCFYSLENQFGQHDF